MAMHDIWNPWHGCVKVSEGCRHCYMYFLDSKRGGDGRRIYRTQTGFNYPLQRNRDGSYKVKSGELIRVCMASDFFLDEADQWRDEAWQMMRVRSDVKFFLLTKRPERVRQCLPKNWTEDGWENVWLNVTCENQEQADFRMPLLLELPFRHKGVMTAPLIGPVNLEPWLATGQVMQVIAGGENYDGARPCYFEWAQSLSEQCRRHDVKFCFIETGTTFVKDGRTYRIPSKTVQSHQALLSGLSHGGRPMNITLRNGFGEILTEEQLYRPVFDGPNCSRCGSRPICNGCCHCGKCRR